MATIELAKAVWAKVPSPLTIITIGLPSLVLYFVVRAIYNVYLHPLRNVPGRKDWIAFPITYHIASIKGIVDRQTIELHNKYGETVRTHPNIVSFTSAQAWKDLYAGKPQIPKMQTMPDDAHQAIFTTNNEVIHARLRRVLNPIFSERGIRKLEPIVRPYVDSCLDNIRSSIKAGEEIEFKSLFNRTAFDIIGALSFGEDFGGLKTGEIHPWIRTIFDMTKIIPFIAMIKDVPGLFELMMAAMPKSAHEQREKHEKFCQEKVTRRLQDEEKKGNGDFIDVMLQSKGTKDAISDGELVTNASELVFAGSETIATALMGLTFWLIKTPSALKKATEEVRSTFEAEDEISFTSTAADRLPYLNACFMEVFRIYSPTQAGVMREVPKGENAIVDGIVLPSQSKGVVHHHAAFTMNSHFHKPYSYVPERWLSEATTDSKSPFYNDNRATVMPFGVGPHRCIGQPLAMNELRYIMTRLLWNFELEKLNASCEHWNVQKAWLAWDKKELYVGVKERSWDDKVKHQKTPN